MPIEFLDEPQTAAPRKPTGVEFIDTPPSGVEFLPDKPQAADVTDIRRRFADPNYEPSLAEFKVYQKAEAAKPLWKPEEWYDTASQAAQGIWAIGKAAVKAIPDIVTDPERNNPLLSVAEGIARGARRDAELLGKMFAPDYETSKWSAWRADKFQKFRADNGRSPNADERKSWDTEWDNEIKPKFQHAAFLANRKQVVREIARSEGKDNMLAGAGEVNNPLAEAASLILSPLALAPFGKALQPAQGLARTAAAKTLEAGGRATEVAGNVVGQAARLPERAAGAMARFVDAGEEGAAKAQEFIARGAVGAALTPAKATAKGAVEAGQAAQAVGRAVASGPSRHGVLARVAVDAQAPQWMRKVANTARALDPAISAAGTAATGAAIGAGLGTVLGGLTDGEEGAAAGFGSGLALGAGGAIVGRAVAGRQYRAGLEEMDLARWFASKSPGELANITRLNLSRDQSLHLADVERMARGAVEPGREGDIEFRYLAGKDFNEMFPGMRGAQTVEGDHPVVFINTDVKGTGSVFHEVLHGLDALEGSSPQRLALNRTLFDQTAPDGTVISQGLYTAADLAEFTKQYRNRLPAREQSEFDLKTPDQKQAAIMGEVRADAMANLLAGRPGSAFPGNFGGLRQRVADALLTADQFTMLGRMRRALESAGVKFEASGQPSELFVKNGRPITNTPAVDAALRDYLRAKDGLTRKLNADSGGDEPRLVVRPGDLLSKGNTGLVEAFKDNDIFARNPDGSVKRLGGVPVLLSEREINLVQSKRTEAMIAALDAAVDAGEPGAVRKQTNGAYIGQHFTDKQMAAFNQLPPELLSPSMKAKLNALNEFAKAGDGSQIILDYNAALKNRRYSSGISATTRSVVPLTMNISKAGNFFMTALDTTHFYRKLGEWRKSKPRAFDAWGGDTDAFLRDTFKYLDNHANGRRGDVNLDADAAVAVNKKNVINDFFNVPKGEGVNPVQISGKGDKDNLIRSRRFDRINRITPGAGDKFPVNYGLQKANFMPGDVNLSNLPGRSGDLERLRIAASSPDAPPAVKAAYAEAKAVNYGNQGIPEMRAELAARASTAEVINHIRAQAVHDISRQTSLSPPAASPLAEAYFNALDRQYSRLPKTERYRQIARLIKESTPAEIGLLESALQGGGEDAVKAVATRLAATKAAAEALRSAR